MDPFVHKHYISDELREFYDDLFVKTRLKDNEAYIYVFIEFQSTNDHFMALRLLNYILLFYLDWIKEHPRRKRLPPVLPIILYNGKFEWKAPDNLANLIEPNSALRPYYPSFRYLMNTITSLRNAKEEKGMLVETIKLWEEDLKEEGRREGCEKGFKEGREIVLRNLARKMKEAGEEPAKITEYTGLSSEEINKL